MGAKLDPGENLLLWLWDPSELKFLKNDPLDVSKFRFFVHPTFIPRCNFKSRISLLLAHCTALIHSLTVSFLFFRYLRFVKFAFSFSTLAFLSLVLYGVIFCSCFLRLLCFDVILFNKFNFRKRSLQRDAIIFAAAACKQFSRISSSGLESRRRERNDQNAAK